MAPDGRKVGIRLIEVLVALLIIAGGIAILLPAFGRSREAARRTTCINNLKQIGLALHEYHDKHQCFPASCQYKTPPGAAQAVNGWSFLVDLLPYEENTKLYDQLDRGDRVEKSFPDDPAGAAEIAGVAGTVVATYCCPTSRGAHFSDPANKSGALSNYKAIGATHAGSLNRAWDLKAPTLYQPDGGNHPDGGLPPNRRMAFREYGDGLSNTAFVAESTEQIHARWIRGDECVVVGFPEKSKASATSFVIPKGAKYYAPAGFEPGKYNYNAESKVVIRPYVEWDYGNADLGHDGTYGETVGRIPLFPATAATEYGIGSNHPGVVNHGFVDGSVHSVSKNVDRSLYFFVLTGNGGDPGGD